MIKNIILGNDEKFQLPRFALNFDKGTPPPPPSKMFTFVFVPINLIMSKIQRDSVLCPAGKTGVFADHHRKSTCSNIEAHKMTSVDPVTRRKKKSI